MRSFLLLAAALMVAFFTCGFVVTIQFPEICRRSEMIVVLRVEENAGRIGWHARVAESIYGSQTPGRIRLDRFTPEPGPKDEVVLSSGGEVHLEVGYSYLAFLRRSPDGVGYLPAATGGDSYFKITDDHITGLLRTEKKRSLESTPIAEAQKRIREALIALRKEPNKAPEPTRGLP